MPGASSAFLHGALGWLYGDTVPASCGRCGYDWSTDPGVALRTIETAPERYEALLVGGDGMATAPDGGWNATAYVWHLTDLARSWSERWAQLAHAPGARLVGWDPDQLAEARNYRQLPTPAARWAFPNATGAFVALSRSLDPGIAFLHGDWGQGTVGDAIRWLAHEYVHHELDVRERISVAMTS
jgi:hypothetical protein